MSGKNIVKRTIKNTMKKAFSFGAACLIVFGVSGCASKQMGSKSSVVDYLYPSDNPPAVQASIPALKLPVRLGIAFVPGQDMGYISSARAGSGLTEVKKMEILEKIATHFRKHEFISDIQTIPSAYLTPRGSFTNLDQIKSMYGIDVIALVSYDQMQFTDEGSLSLSYWTIVGAYLVSAQKNDTNTIMDTVVYDIESRKMLFRAPGSSVVKGRSTPVNLPEELRTDSVKGFELSTAEMISNLELQLTSFREKLKTTPITKNH